MSRTNFIFCALATEVPPNFNTFILFVLFEKAMFFIHPRTFFL
jgi:hypothetical protein